MDDDDAVRAVMMEVLGRKGFDVVAAASVTEALRPITIESFDVLITDLHNLSSLGFSTLLPNVMTIADEVDAQLTQSMVAT